MSKLIPFANESDALIIGNLNIENRIDRVSLFGDIDLTRDQAGLANARALKALLEDVVKALEADKTLPATLPAPSVTKVKNPF